MKSLLITYHFLQDQAKILHKTLQSLTLTSICMNAEFLLAY